MAHDMFDREVPEGGDAADVPGAFRTYSLSDLPGPRTVTSRAHANTVVGSVQSSGGDPTGLHVWRTDTNQEERWNGTEWEYVSGRQHGATVTFARPGLASGGTPWLLYADSFQRASPGWTVASNRIVIPATGLYLMTVITNVDGSASGLGRVFGQIAIGGNPVQMRMGTAVDEDNYGYTLMWPFTAGDRLQPTHYHASGGARDVTATMQIAMINSPSW